MKAPTVNPSQDWCLHVAPWGTRIKRSVFCLVSCRVTVQENPGCTVCYIVSLMYFFCALNEAFICREIGFEAADEIVMVSMICLAAEQAISWWIMLNHRGCHPATLSHGSKAINVVSCSVNVWEPGPRKEDDSNTFIKESASILVD